MWEGVSPQTQHPLAFAVGKSCCCLYSLSMLPEKADNGICNMICLSLKKGLKNCDKIELMKTVGRTVSRIGKIGHLFQKVDSYQHFTCLTKCAFMINNACKWF